MIGQRELEAIWLDDEPQPITLAAGRFSMQLRGDSFSDVTFDGVTVLRAIRFIVRDRDWRTIPADIISLEVTGPDGTDPDDPDPGGVGPDDIGPASSMRITIHARNRGRGIDLEWKGVLDLSAGSLRFEAQAIALNSFLRNRIGIVLLHPAECAGLDLFVRHPSGDTTRTRFPEHIAPHQPATDIAGLAWTADGVRADLAVNGEVFEMEDQRNWTDASFKTYSTPLSIPFPVEVSGGDAITQDVTLRCERTDASRVGGSGSAVVLERGDLVMPQLLVGASTAPDPGPGRPPGIGTERPPWLADSGLLVELDASTPNWPAVLDRAGREAGDAGLDVRIIASTPDQVGSVLDSIADRDSRVLRVGVFDAATHISNGALWETLLAGTHARSISAELVGGARSHFTELNRNHESLPAALPSLTFSVTPQMHELSRAQVIESVAMQRLVAEQAVRIADGRRVHVGPVTLRPRFNAVSTSARRVDSESDLRHGYGAQLVEGATDPRQQGNGYAAWVLASAAALSVAGVASVTFAETWGPRGLRDDAGHRYPASYAIEWLAAIAGWRRLVAPTDSVAGPLAVIGAEHDGETVLLLTNASSVPDEIVVALPIPAVPGGTIERLAPGAHGVATTSAPYDGKALTVSLAPGEIARWTAGS